MSMNVSLSDTAGNSAGQSKIPFENGQVEMNSSFTSGALPGSGPELFLSLVEAAKNPIFDSPPSSFASKNIDDFDAKNIDDVV